MPHNSRLYVEFYGGKYLPLTTSHRKEKNQENQFKYLDFFLIHLKKEQQRNILYSEAKNYSTHFMDISFLGKKKASKKKKISLHSEADEFFP